MKHGKEIKEALAQRKLALKAIEWARGVSPGDPAIALAGEMVILGTAALRARGRAPEQFRQELIGTARARFTVAMEDAKAAAIRSFAIREDKAAR